jgi:hypothetical protein
MPYLTTQFCFDLVETVASTLRYLEFAWSVDGFRASIPAFGKLLRVVPQLAELRIVADSDVYPHLLPLNEGDLVSVSSVYHVFPASFLPWCIDSLVHS